MCVWLLVVQNKISKYLSIQISIYLFIYIDKDRERERLININIYNMYWYINIYYDILYNKHLVKGENIGQIYLYRHRQREPANIYICETVFYIKITDNQNLLPINNLSVD